MREVPRVRVDLEEADRKTVREAWNAYRRAQTSEARARRNLVRLLLRLRKRYPVAAIARAAGVSPMAVWNKLKK